MIDFIVSVWFDNEIITKEIVYNSFRTTGISNKLNRSEDGLFKVWSKIKEEIPNLRMIWKKVIKFQIIMRYQMKIKKNKNIYIKI